MCLGHISASVPHIFTSLHSARSTPTSALQSLAVPTISTSVERHSLAHVSRVSQTIFTTGFVASTVSEWRSAATATSSAAAVVECCGVHADRLLYMIPRGFPSAGSQLLLEVLP